MTKARSSLYSVALDIPPKNLETIELIPVLSLFRCQVEEMLHVKPKRDILMLEAGVQMTLATGPKPHDPLPVVLLLSK